MSDILDKIIAVKRQEIAEAIRRKPLASCAKTPSHAC
jgi:indole-3-glycerol phosphate synthase